MGIFLTSGTTSGPKGVCHSSESLVGNAIAFNNQNKIIIFETKIITHIYLKNKKKNLTNINI